MSAPEATAVQRVEWPDPTPAMLRDPIFNAIWNEVKAWDVAVPGAYQGYIGGTGNHARAIYDAVRAAVPPRLVFEIAKADPEAVAELRRQIERGPHGYITLMPEDIGPVEQLEIVQHLQRRETELLEANTALVERERAERRRAEAAETARDCLARELTEVRAATRAEGAAHGQ